MKIEYKVRPVTRYVVTRFHDDGRNQGSELKGQFDNELTAYEVANALARHESADHDLGSVIGPDLPEHLWTKPSIL